MPDYTTTEFVVSVRERAMLTRDQNLWDDAAVLRKGTQAMQFKCMARLRNFAEGYQQHYVDLTVGTDPLKLPQRTMGQLRDVQYAQTNDPRYLASIPKIDTPRVGEGVQHVGAYFELQGDSIVLPSYMTTGLLRLYYLLRPSKLVRVAECAEVASVSGAVITCAATPPATITTGSLVDLVSLEQPSFRPRMIEVEVAGVSGNDITLSVTPTGTQVPVAGEYVALAGTSCVPQIPFEMFSFLEQRTAVDILATSKGMTEIRATAAALLEDELTAMEALLAPRVDGEPNVLINTYSPLRLMSGGSRRRFR